MNKMFIFGVVVLGLLVISGCCIEPGKSLAGQAGNRGGSGSEVVLSDSGKVCQEFYYMEPDGVTISGPFVCTEYQEKGVEKGTPWCATKVTNPGGFYVSGSKYGTDWDYCTKAFESGKVGDISIAVTPGGSRAGGGIGPKGGSESGGGVIDTGYTSDVPGIDGGSPGSSENGLVPDTTTSSDDKGGEEEKKNPTVVSESACLTKSKPVKVGVAKGDSVCVDRLIGVGVLASGDKASLDEISDISTQLCEGIVRGVVIVRDPVTKELSAVKWKNPNIFLAAWSGACEGAVAKKGGPSSLEEVDSSCLINPEKYGDFFIQKCDLVQWTLPCDLKTQFGCDCDVAGDCNSGMCVKRDWSRPWLGQMCTKSCSNNPGCPSSVNTKGEGLLCKQVGSSAGNDIVTGCVGLLPK